MEKLSHAYILVSPSAEMRREMAQELAAEMLCTGAGKKPCGQCRNCRKIFAGIHPDVITITRLTDDKGRLRREIQVDQIREMAADAAVLPNEAEGKVYIIEDADTMNLNAQNAALKIFEEPPRGVRFLLCTANAERFLPTIRSRCAEKRKNAEDEEAPEEIRKLAQEYVSCLVSGNKAELLSRCFAMESLDGRKTADFVNCAKSELAALVKNAEYDRKAIMDNITVLDKCSEYLAVNTGPKHVFGYMAVKALPIKEKLI